MDDIPAHILLREALELLNDRPNFGLRRAPAVTSYELAGRIDTYFSRRRAAPTLIDQARRQFGECALLTFDTPAGPDTARWVPAWVALGSDGEITRKRAALDRALASLPPITREAYLAHRDRDMDYRAIAVELGIGVADVQRHIARALVRLDEALDRA